MRAADYSFEGDPSLKAKEKYPSINQSARHRRALFYLDNVYNSEPCLQTTHEETLFEVNQKREWGFG